MADYPYKRVNHFEELLKELKSDDSIRLTKETNTIIENIKNDFENNEKLFNHNTLQKYLRRKHLIRFYNKVEQVLKLCGGPWVKKKYVNNAVLILFAHTDENSLFSSIPKELVEYVSKKCVEVRKYKIKTLELSADDEQSLIDDFKQVNDIYNKIIKEEGFERKSFFSYRYLLNKLLEKNNIHTENDVECLRNSTKLLCQDRYWQKVCKELGWKYKSSFE